MRGLRRFSQAISEGDGISLLVEVATAAEAAAAATAGAEAVIAHGDPGDLRAATDLPILWAGRDAPDDAVAAGADAVLLRLRGADEDDGAFARLHDRAVELGLDCAVAVHDEDELQLALEAVDPEILVLSAAATGADGLEHVLGLLPDVPAGKLAIAEVRLAGEEDVAQLERAGVDGVIVPAGALAGLLRAAANEA